MAAGVAFQAYGRDSRGPARRCLPFDTPLEVATHGARSPPESLQSLPWTSASPILHSISVTFSVPLRSMSILSGTDIFAEQLATDKIVDHRQSPKTSASKALGFKANGGSDSYQLAQIASIIFVLIVCHVGMNAEIAATA
jgi:hypothetical protein